MCGRSVVIGDIPWVAQSIEAYLSKLFACSYSAAGLAVYSGNPNDHLVHRLTHRVVRGGLLCVGRPDGRLMALTTSECSACLSTSQVPTLLYPCMNCSLHTYLLLILLIHTGEQHPEHWIHS